MSALPNESPLEAPRKYYSPILWLSLLCLDAPFVAVVWQWLFARCFGARLPLSLPVLLFLSAWVIYLIDRFADAIRLSPENAISLRHQFCRDHLLGWWIAIIVVFLAVTMLALRALDLQMLLLGGTLAALCAIYLVINHSLGEKWPPFPMKEKAIGVLFAAGTTLGVVGQLPSLTISFAVAVVLFALLCTFNCLSIASWERELDLAQGKISLLLHWPIVARALRPFGLTIAAVALALAIWWRFAAPLWLCLAGSAFLLVWLLGTTHLRTDTRTALADLALLTPILVRLL